MPRSSRKGRRVPSSVAGAEGEDWEGNLPSEWLPIQSVSPERHIQSLWAGYGSVSSVSICTASNETVSLIIKRVTPPSDGVGISHERKVKSYCAEAYFYQHLASQLSPYSASCVVPHSYSIQSKDGGFLFCMSDLRHDFSDSNGSLSIDHTKAALRWLAHFHATFWNNSSIPTFNNDNDTHTDLHGIWECGGYWHFETRQDEWQDISSSSSWKTLKQCAGVIDERMKQDDQFHTVCHGDFKSANILLDPDGTKCAAVDFQYVGGGYGMKDVVMLLVSSCSSGRGDTKRWESDMLQFYHETLTNALSQRPNQNTNMYSLEVATMHFELCLLDYVRFMAGWGFWGSNCNYATTRAQTLLQELEAMIPKTKQQNQMREEDWREIINTRFPLSSSS
jgi:hypothetical protein